MDSEDLDNLYTRVAESFGIEFDSYAAEAGTLGTLYEYILWKLGLTKRESACLCPPTFFTLRRALASQSGQDAKSITLDTQLADLLPWYRRRRTWRRLSETLRVGFPDLADFPGALIISALLWAFVAFPLMIVSFVLLIDENSSTLRSLIIIVLVVGLQIPVWLLLVRFSRFLQFRLPYGCRTVGELVECLVYLNSTQLRARFGSQSIKTGVAPFDILRGQSRCTRVAGFLRLRRALAETTGRNLKVIRPETPLTEVVGRFGRRTTWRILELNLGWELPGLRRSRFVIGLCVAGYLAILATNIDTISDIRLIWWLGLPYWFLAYVCTIPFAAHFPKDCTTVNDLTDAVIDLNYGQIATAYNSLRTDEVWSVLRDLVAEVSGVRREDVLPGMPLIDSTQAV